MNPSSASSYLIALVFRLVNAFISRSFFQPDEYWQSLEVAHLLVFGYGYKTWEWRTTDSASLGEWGSWKRLMKDGGAGGIRSPLSVLPTAVLYQILRGLNMDDTGEWLVLAPRLLQAFIAASTDVAFRKLAETALGSEYGNGALLVSLTSFFNFFTSTRTFSNSTETALTAWALVRWPWRSDTTSSKDVQDENKAQIEDRSSGSLPIALSFAAVATIIRPSNAVIWLILGSRLFLQSSARQRISILVSASIVAFAAIVVSLAVDTWFYQTPTFTPLRFLSTNVFHSISLFYGQNPWHFYLLQGVPLLLLTQLPFLLDGILKMYRSTPSTSTKNLSALKELGWTATGTIASYSALSHKEWRFLHPILPILHLFVTLSLVSAYQSTSHPPAPAPQLRRLSLTTRGLHPLERLVVRSRIKLSHLLVLLASLLPAIYLASFHQRGQNDVMLWLRDEMRAQRTGKAGRVQGRKKGTEVRSVGFAMPCHSTPWQSHLHSRELEEEGRLWFITCEPPISGQPQDIYLDHSDHFYLSPSTYFLSRFPPSADSTFPPSTVSYSADPFSTPSSTHSTPEARQELIENQFDRQWKYSSWPSHLVVFQDLLDTPCRPEEPCSGME
ncbi:putative glycosylphosphatidylinositol-alpha 1,2 mannosyltransferase [Sporobolomyces salmoneus]|uniref:putative glycosylphosphatidylinositol-alpha 1,2 mannosyltransferase n=1 Tax=Sporobolomyces salmoneus TaxID=183962 RepID=UPI00317ECB2E